MNILWQVVHTSDNGVEEEGLATKRKDEDRPKKDNQCRQETENNLFGGAVRAGMAVKELAPVEQEKSGREEGEGGGKRKWEDAVPACSAKTEMSREERKMQQQLEIFKKMEMLQANARGGGGGSGKRESEGGATSRGAGERVVDRSMDARRDDSTGADVARAMEREKERERERKRERERERERAGACREALGCAVGPEVKSELTREERKMRQQLELFKKMEDAAKLKEGSAGGGAGGGKTCASAQTAGQSVGAGKGGGGGARKAVDADRGEEASGESSDDESGKHGQMRSRKAPKSRWEDAVRQRQRERGGGERESVERVYREIVEERVCIEGERYWYVREV